MRTGNPALNPNVYQAFEASAGDRFEMSADRFDMAAAPADTMTIGGTTMKTGALVSLAVLTGGFTWSQFFAGANVMPWIIGGLIGGIVFALITAFKPVWAPITAPAYAAAEGLLLGGISAQYASLYEGIVMQAVLLTLGVLITMLAAFGFGLVRVTDKFRAGVFAATGGILLVYLATFVLSFFNVGIPYIHGSGMIGIGFSLFVVIIAALNLVLDFDFIQRGVDDRAPKYMEWYGAFGLMVTLVWLYIEILRLLAKLQSRD
jgi:uncharacterized YccA/Bax inhibitor family protein